MTRRTNQRATLARRHDVVAGSRPTRRAIHIERRPTPAESYRALLMAGFTTVEAGNLLALESGLRPVAGGWRLREIEALLFLRDLLERRRNAAGLPVAD